MLGVTGSIAAYKSAELASLLVKQGHEVFVVMTHDAAEFISPLTLQTLSKNPVMTSFFDEKESWRPGHIEFADRANLLLIAPATAHIHRRARVRSRRSSAGGDRARHPRADSDCAGDERKNVGASRDAGERGKTQGARRRIHRAGRRNAGVRVRRTRPVVESERDRVPRGISSYPARQTDRVTFLITAGPTREPIDPVRYISNRSSGKMGYAIAEAALDAGHDVILISGPVNLAPPRDAKFISVSTSDEMFDAVHQHADSSDICVLCAAVADYKPAQVSPVKIKKCAAQVSLELVPTRDILQSLGRTGGSQISSRWIRRGNGSPRSKRHEKTARKELRYHRRERCAYRNGDRRK